MTSMLTYVIYTIDGKGGKKRACNKGPFYGDYLSEGAAQLARKKLPNADLCWVESCTCMG